MGENKYGVHNYEKSCGYYISSASSDERLNFPF